MRRAWCLFRDTFLTPLFFRFVFGGVGGFIFRIAFTYLITEYFSINYFINYFIAASVTTCVNFIIAAKYIFKVDDKKHRRFARFCMLTAIFFATNLTLVKTLTTIGLHYILSIITVTGFLLIIKFFVFDWFVFHKELK
ncbi:hypothetical protein D6825_01410 [Candidatus Woesearchaeota archaeon]|nr:MAG: hypothetical protein D6825_01410 [Candidatus Woesearchaeota archaeon]